MNIQTEDETLESFNAFLADLPRSEVSALITKLVSTTSTDINSNFFLKPHKYQPYFDFIGPQDAEPNSFSDLSLVSMEVLRYLYDYSGNSEERVLDYACGIPTLSLYLQQLGFESRGFDRWIQIKKSVAQEYLLETRDLDWKKSFHSESQILDSKLEIYEWDPTIISVAGYWIEDLDLYQLPSLKYVLSDPLYNSGRIKGEGVYHYKPNWQSTPDDLGLKLVSSKKYLDIYERVL